MTMFPLFLLVIFLLTRTNSSYNPQLLFKKHFPIKKKFLSKLLVSESNPVNRSKNSKSNRNKITYAGIVLHMLFLLVCCFSIIMYLLPSVPCKTYVTDTRFIYLLGDTLNEILSISFSFILFYINSAFLFINTANHSIENAKAKKFTKFLHYFLVILFCVGIIFEIWQVSITIIRL